MLVVDFCGSVYGNESDEEGIARKSGLMRRVKHDEEAHFSPQFPSKRALPGIKLPSKKNDKESPKYNLDEEPIIHNYMGKNV